MANKKKLKKMEKGKKKKKSWFGKLKPASIESLMKRNKKMKKLLDALDEK